MNNDIMSTTSSIMDSMSGMSMGTSSMNMPMSSTPTSTMPGMSMATPTESSMSMSDGSVMMGMDSMAMVFFTSTNTPLYSWAWTPRSAGQYAGTCIFLIALATIFRGLVTVRMRYHEILAVVRNRRLGDMGFIAPTMEKSVHDTWRADKAVILATLDLILAGVSYLLMLAVMTMNVGYFLSVLAGVFLGSMMFAQLSSTLIGH